MVARARRGDQNAFGQLVARYRPLVRSLAAGYYLPGGQADDLMQEGLVGLHKAVRDFRVDGGASFRTFAQLCIGRQILTALKMATRQKHLPLNRYVSFSAPFCDDDDGDVVGDRLADAPEHDPASAVISSERLLEVARLLRSELSQREARVLSLTLDGCSYVQVAGSLGLSVKAVDNALQRVRRKVRRGLAASDYPEHRRAA